jgi:hypothetical protein
VYFAGKRGIVVCIAHPQKNIAIRGCHENDEFPSACQFFMLVCGIGDRLTMDLR